MTALNSGDIKKEDLGPAILELQAPLGTLWEDRAMSTKAVDTGELSVLKEMANSKAWIQDRI